MFDNIKQNRRRAAAIAMASALAGSLALVPQAVAAEPGPVAERSVFLNPEGDGGVERPVLDSIKQTAEEQGISLGEALDFYVSKAGAEAEPTPEDQPDGPVDTPDVTVDDLTAGELEDILAMATDEGIPFTEAIDQYGWQDQFTEVVNELETSFPDEFSGGVKSGDDAWFAFKGEAPAEAVELVGSLPVPVEVVSNRGFSEGELAAAQDAAHAQVLAQSGVRDAVSFYDVKEGEVRVQAELDSSSTKGAARSAAARKSISSTVDVGDIPVTVQVVNDASYEKQDGKIRGGGYLSIGCTAGFNLKQISGNTKRLGTAGHCTTVATQKYSNHSTHGGSTTVSTKWSHQGDGGDLGYTSKGDKASTRTFYHNVNKSRYADKRGSMPAVGTSICKFGRTSGKTCSTVRYKNVNAGGLGHMVVMNGNACKPGDSGGPWFSGGTAYGIHTGIVPVDGAQRCIFTPAYLYQNRGYDVWTR
ncbi:S1 family peptidase [Streptomyces europaeiscabiei]|uniref:S1 family peptidase n=2 Tax=Streptomyces europaeiscabiei TaxID=146819 RepID=A0AAJ2PWN8_9ACTN|nr:S1 family peptidase [Streptomyces europaeiscabiei]MDX3134739.1 S1 family peptidase [Streptomyces europaeiscabiei]